MKQNVLFLVHVENTFRKFFPDEMYVNRLIRACQAKKYDKVFILVSNVNDYAPIDELAEITGRYQWIDWGWGYDPECFSHDPEELAWVIPAYGHEYTWVPNELRDMADELKRSNVFVGGGYESECLQDWLDCLDHFDIPFKKIHGYIY